MTTPTLAIPGWRVILADRESGGSVMLPIVAWDTQWVEDAAGREYLRPWFAPIETGVPPQPLSDRDLLVGSLRQGKSTTLSGTKSRKRYSRPSESKRSANTSVSRRSSNFWTNSIPLRSKRCSERSTATTRITSTRRPTSCSAAKTRSGQAGSFGKSNFGGRRERR